MKLQNNYPLIQTVRKPETFRTPENWILKLLIFIAAFFVSQIIAGIPMTIAIMPRLLDWVAEQIDQNGAQSVTTELMTQKLNSLLMDPANFHITLYAFGAAMLVFFFFVKVVEGRKLGTLGFRKKGGAVQYLIGLAVGFVLFSLVVLLSWCMGGVAWDGLKNGITPGVLVILGGYAIQGMCEEVMCRGTLMTDVLRHKNVWWAVGLNSLMFGVLHAYNNGFSLFTLVNLVLFGVMASLYVLRTDNLWGACAIHSIWNFVQGNFFGLPVSGVDSGESIFSMHLTGSALANGGDFGLEASLATTIVMLAAIAVLLFVPLPFCKNGQAENSPAEQEGTA